MNTSVDFEKIALEICKREKFTLDKNSQEGGSFRENCFKVTSSGDNFALKIFKTGSRSPRVLREINAIQKCNHPRVAKIFQFNTITYDKIQYDYIIEEYLGGGTLNTYLNSGKKLSEKEIDILGINLIETLNRLNERKLVHRDIKPDNIMFRSESFEPVLLDFSIVRDLSDVSLTQSWLARGPGTPLFSAPEQLNNQKKLIDWRTDQFSLGVVLSLCAFGMHPYQKDGSEIYSHETVEQITLRERNKKFFSICSQSKFSCLDKMTRPWPVERYRSPQELTIFWNKQ